MYIYIFILLFTFGIWLHSMNELTNSMVPYIVSIYEYFLRICKMYKINKTMDPTLFSKSKNSLNQHFKIRKSWLI